jgi:hypothetical protein
MMQANDFDSAATSAIDEEANVEFTGCCPSCSMPWDGQVRVRVEGDEDRVQAPRSHAVPLPDIAVF